MNGIEKGRYVIHWSGKREARCSVGIFMSLYWADWLGRWRCKSGNHADNEM